MMVALRQNSIIFFAPFYLPNLTHPQPYWMHINLDLMVAASTMHLHPVPQVSLSCPHHVYTYLLQTYRFI